MKLPAASQSRNHCFIHKETSIQVVSTLTWKFLSGLTQLVTLTLISLKKGAKVVSGDVGKFSFITMCYNQVDGVGVDCKLEG